MSISIVKIVPGASIIQRKQTKKEERMTMEKTLRSLKKKSARIIFYFRSGKFTRPLLIMEISEGTIKAIAAESQADFPLCFFKISDVEHIETE